MVCLLAMMVAATNLKGSLDSARKEFRSFFRASLAPKLRSMREFAEQEITLPTGLYKDFKFRCERLPWTTHWFDAIDSGQYIEHALTAITQGGKSLCGFVIPALYHLFEIGETVVCGLPSMDIAGDKWREDFLPVIELTRYASLLPTAGKGSKGANTPTSIKFRNGSTLRFMSGGGDDKSRSHFNTRVIVITEADGLDSSAETSKETTKIHQIEARARSFGDRKRIYKECTVSNEEGHIWSRYITGTHSRLVLPCPHCKTFVLPDRENLLGWQDATDEMTAREQSHFYCPECGEAWSDTERHQANTKAVLLHRGQSIGSDGVVTGDHPATRVLGFRATAVHNLFLSPSELGADEWNAAREPVPEVAEKRMMQFVWALPYKSPDIEDEKISVAAVRGCTSGTERGIVPETHPTLILATDMGKWKSHWYVMAFAEDGSPHTVEVGEIEMATADIGIELAFERCLNEVERMALAGWQVEGIAEKKLPLQIWIDSRYQTDVVCKWIAGRERRGLFLPTQGHGTGQYRSSPYQKPSKVGSEIKMIGEEYHISWHPIRRVHIVHINADYWKSWLHARINTKANDDGSPTRGRFSVYNPRGVDKELRELAQHLASEHREQKFVQGKGLVTKWVCHSSKNHWLDGAALCCAAAHYCGVRITGPEPQAVIAPRPVQKFNQRTSPYDRPFLVSER